MPNLDTLETKPATKRGWIFDQLMIVGQLEASMCHTDENVCNIYSDIDNNSEDVEFIGKKSNELATNNEIMQLDYENRVDALNDIFDAVEGSDRHYFCAVKHRATTFVIAAENWHARKGDPKAEQTMVKAGRSLALTCSLAFGFEPMDCLRCVGDSLANLKNN